MTNDWLQGERKRSWERSFNAHPGCTRTYGVEKWRVEKSSVLFDFQLYEHIREGRRRLSGIYLCLIYFAVPRFRMPLLLLLAFIWYLLGYLLEFFFVRFLLPAECRARGKGLLIFFLFMINWTEWNVMLSLNGFDRIELCARDATKISISHFTIEAESEKESKRWEWKGTEQKKSAIKNAVFQFKWYRRY